MFRNSWLVFLLLHACVLQGLRFFFFNKGCKYLGRRLQISYDLTEGFVLITIVVQIPRVGIDEEWKTVCHLFGRRMHVSCNLWARQLGSLMSLNYSGGSED